LMARSPTKFHLSSSGQRAVCSISSREIFVRCERNNGLRVVVRSGRCAVHMTSIRGQHGIRLHNSSAP
jgi:hypothetical protein